MQRCAIASVFILSFVFVAEAGPRRRAVRVPTPPLIVSAIEPNRGPIAGGSTVTIRGSGFFPSDLQVSFDGLPAASVTLVSVDELLAVTPPHANGYAAVRVVNDGRIASSRFLYVPPSLNSISDGEITTVAGIGEGAPAKSVPFDVAGFDLAVDTDGSVITLGSFGLRGFAAAPNGDIYVTGPYDVGRISPDGTYTRLAGGDYGYSGDGGPASAAKLDNPAGIVIDAAGNLFVADKYNHCIRRIDAQSGIITTFAGRAPVHLPNVQIENPSTGDGGPAVDAQLRAPIHLALDGAGNLYVSDVGGVRMIDRNGIIDTVVANRCQGAPLTSDSSGRVYVYCFDGAILRIDGKNSTTTIGTIRPEFGFTGDGGPATAAKTRTIQALAIDRSGNVYLWDFDNRRVRAIRGIAR